MSLLVTGLTGCTDALLTNPSRGEDAEALRGRLADLPGVASARLTYAEPVPLDSGKLQLQVRMAADTAPDDVATVVRTAYDGFRGKHFHEEGDLDVDFGLNNVHLRSFEPDVEPAGVVAAAERAAEAAELGRIDAGINTQDVAVRGEPDTMITLVLGAGTTAKDVLPALRAVDRHVGDEPRDGWGVRAGDDSRINDGDGLPSAELRRLFATLAGRPLPGARTVVSTGDYPASPDVDLQAFVAADVAAYTLPGRTVREEDLRTYVRAQSAAVQSISPEGEFWMTLDDLDVTLDQR